MKAINVLEKNDALSLALHYSGNKNSSYAPIVCLHGWGSNSSIWKALIEHLGEDFYFISIDLPGFGDSESICIDNVDDLIAELANKIPDPCHILGWSLGGMLAIALANRSESSVLSVTTIASNLKFVADEDWKHACDPAVFKNFQQELTDDPTSLFGRFTQLQGHGDKQRKKVVGTLREIQELRETRAEPLSHHQKAWQFGLEFLQVLDLRKELAQIAEKKPAQQLFPISGIFGRGDSLVPSAAVEDIQNSVEKNYRAYVLDGAGHVPHISQPEKVAAILKNTLIRSQRPYHREKEAISHAFSAAAESYDKVADLQRRVAARVVGLNHLESKYVCDVGCGTGFLFPPLIESGCTLVGVDIAPGMLRVAEQKFGESATYLCADFDYIPLDGSRPFDAMISSMSLQWSENLCATLSHLSLFLTRGGTFQFATLGESTLHELGSAWSAVDDFVHVNQFENVSTLLDHVCKAGFTIEYQEVVFEELYYDSTLGLMKDLKGIGAHNVNAGKPTGMTTRQQLRKLETAYETFRLPEGKLPATYEIVYIVAKKNGE